MKNRFILCVLVVTTTVLVSCQATVENGQRNCRQVVGAFDIGSGSTKYKVAEVDFCKNTIHKVLFADDISVGYKADLGRGQNGAFSKSIISQGLAAVGQLIQKGEPFQPTKVTGVATSAFRKATNGDQVAVKISTAYRFPVKIISQQEEAQLGYWAAKPHQRKPSSKLVVWDIGGGSMQVMTYEKGSFVTYLGNVASVETRDWLIQSVLKKDPEKVSSPNPIGQAGVEAIANKVKGEARRFPKALKKYLKDPSSEVIGIGGVHYYSISGQLQSKEKPYSLSSMEKVLNIKKSWADSQLGGDYASTDVVNLAIVSSFMRELKIKEVLAVQANIADGLFLSPKYFKKYR